MKREIQFSGKFLIDEQFIYWAVAKLNDEIIYVRQLNQKEWKQYHRRRQQIGKESWEKEAAHEFCRNEGI